MMIHAEKCLALGLPAPHSYDTQRGYIVRVMAEGFVWNTRTCRYVGIHNLHSILSTMRSKGIEFTLAYERVRCPFTGDIPPYPVDVAYMTQDQQAQYRQHKKEKAAKE